MKKDVRRFRKDGNKKMARRAQRKIQEIKDFNRNRQDGEESDDDDNMSDDEAE